MFQNGQKVVVVSGGDPARVIKVQSASGTPDPSRYPVVDTTGVTGRDQQVQIVSGGDATRFPILRGVSDARGTADAVISALTPAAWYRNATGVTSAGGFASQWDDYSGNGRHLVQGVGTKQPAYAAGVLTFDGVDNSMVAASWSQTQPETIYVVLKMVTWALNDYMMDGTSGSAALIQNPTTPSFLANAYSNYGTNANLAVGSFGIVCYVINTTSSSTRVNNTAKVTGFSGAANMGGFTLGSYLDGNSAAANIAVQEVVIFGAAHNDTNQSAVITALNNALTVF